MAYFDITPMQDNQKRKIIWKSIKKRGNQNGVNLEYRLKLRGKMKPV